jgi:hypothetical protein
MKSYGQARVPQPIEHATNLFKEQASRTPELAREAFWRLLDNAKDCQKRINRALITMAIFGLIFELLNRRLLSEVSVVGLKFAKLETLLFIPPIVIGFEAFYGASAFRDRSVMNSAYSRLSDAVYPDFHSSDVDVLLVVPSGIVTSIFPNVWINNEAAGLAWLLNAVEYVLFAALLPVGLPVYTLVQLFRHTGPAAPESWISAIFTISLMVIAWLTMRSTFKGMVVSE